MHDLFPVLPSPFYVRLMSFKSTVRTNQSPAALMVSRRCRALQKHSVAYSPLVPHTVDAIVDIVPFPAFPPPDCLLLSD